MLFLLFEKNKKSSFLKLPEYVNIDYILSVKYTRTIDVSNCISISGTTLLIETKEILNKKKVEICISKRIGMKVRFNDKWYKIIPISMQNKKSFKSNESVEAIIVNFVYFYCLKYDRLSAYHEINLLILYIYDKVKGCVKNGAPRVNKS